MRYRPSRASTDRVSATGVVAPTLIEVTPQGSAVVYYGEQPMAEFRSLDLALRFHRLTHDDLEAD
jgi:hypothetical protein